MAFTHRLVQWAALRCCAKIACLGRIIRVQTVFRYRDTWRIKPEARGTAGYGILFIVHKRRIDNSTI